MARYQQVEIRVFQIESLAEIADGALSYWQSLREIVAPALPGARAL